MFRRSSNLLNNNSSRCCSSIFKSSPLLLQRGGGGKSGPTFEGIGPTSQNQGQRIRSPLGGREGKVLNPFAAEVHSLKRLLVIVNPQSGWKEASSAFAQHVTETLDTTGVIHRIHTVPPEDLKNVLREERKTFPTWDAVLMCGGDGSINAYSYLMTLPEFSDFWLKRPLSILPAGTNNGVAHSLGIGNAISTTASFISGRKRQVPIWKATIHNYDDPPNSPGTILSTSVCSINFGVFTDTLVTGNKIKNWLLGFVMLPVPKKRNYFSSMYHISQISEDNAMPLSVRYTTLPKKDPKTGFEIPGSGNEIAALEPGKGLHMLYGSQMKFHHKSYSLTPKAHFGQMFIGPWYEDDKPKMTVTIARAETSRSRMMHLLQREGPECELELEDGIETFECKGMEIAYSSSGKKGNNNKKKVQKFLLDGEECELLPGQSLKIQPTDVFLNVMIP